MVYALDEEHHEQIVARAVDAVADLEGVDLVMWCERDGQAEGVDPQRPR